MGEDYSIQESTTYVALSNLKMLYFHKVDKSLYINKLWIADYNIQKNCVKFIRNGNQQFVININEVLKKKKHVPNILSYFNSLLSSQKPEIFVEPKSLQRYFHFS